MPGQYGTSVMPNPTPLQTALGTGAVLGGIYGNIGNRGNTDLANTTTQRGLQMTGAPNYSQWNDMVNFFDGGYVG